MSLSKISENQCFGGLQQRFSHPSSACSCEMTFAIYLPPNASEKQKVPVIYWLSGLTCTDENFIQKAGAQRAASSLGVAIVAPDTSPRGDDVADAERYDLGKGAGFYLNATRIPWAKHYQMYDYIVKELPELIEANFPVSSKRAISGHSMGGHGALTIALKNPLFYSSVSAFSPIANPINCEWGQTAFKTYLGDETDQYCAYDACELILSTKSSDSKRPPMLVDQGSSDEFLEKQLQPEALVNAAKDADYPLSFRMQKGYDHSYYFIASFIEDHLHFHAEHFFNE
uniref:S-formylglutathione hydrolase n=1 Tax=Ningiella ruwaisensis TaxID=2364274 RepID=UPI00109FF814|nr:S-formylglutathione hydrolase [Ningiella ruwaisensis]